MVNAVQVWNPDDWEAFALNLLQLRHGPLNVQKIPATHKGDFGIDYYCTTDAVAYQCYAVQEPIDVATRADRQKSKITTDTRKFVSNYAQISTLFLGVPAKHWVLLVPLHDSKDVNLHCSKKTQDIRALKCSHLNQQFQVSIHDKNSFPAHAVAAGMSALAKVTLDVPLPTEAEMMQWQAGSANLLANATHKLTKRAGSKVKDAVAEAIQSFLQGNAILDSLRSSAPDLHEKVIAVVTNRSRRLHLAGPLGGSQPASILNTEIDSLVASIKIAASNLSDENAEQIALGAVAEWLMRCPLDFN